eukprot:6841301-Pyramimonas_sp.AAC.1
MGPIGGILEAISSQLGSSGAILETILKHLGPSRSPLLRPSRRRKGRARDGPRVRLLSTEAGA